MTTTRQPTIAILHVSDALLAQLQPFLADLAITTTLAPQQIDTQRQQLLTMQTDVYDALVARVGATLDYDVRWGPNEYEPDGFVERVRPLEQCVATNMHTMS